MAQVTVSINGRPHTIGCDDGEEARLLELSQALDGQVRDLVQAVGDIGDSRLLVIAGMSLIDKISEMEAGGPAAAAGDTAPDLADTSEEDRARADAAEALLEKAENRADAAEQSVADLKSQLAAVTKRIESIAAGLEEA